MPRQDGLLRLYETLLARRAYQRKKLAGELANLRDFKAADSTGDSVDGAFATSSDEMSSQLAELEADELGQIERALARLRQGKYGVCEGGSQNCQKQIRVARLNALPYTTFCVNCERDMEKYPNWPGQQGAGNWKEVFDWEAPLERPRINLSELEMELSSNRWG